MNKLVLLLMVGVLMMGGCASHNAFMALVNGTQAEYIKSVGGVDAFKKLDIKELHILCKMYVQIGDFQHALECIDTHSQRFGEDHMVFTVANLGLKGWIYYSLNNNESMLKTANSSIQLMNEQGLDKENFFSDESMTSFFNVVKTKAFGLKALALYRLNRLSESDEVIVRLHSSMTWVRKQTSILRRQVYNDIAPIYMSMHKYEDAANLFKEDEGKFSFTFVSSIAGAITKKIGDTSLYYIARADLENLRYAQAIHSFKKLESYHSILENPKLHWLYLYHYARAHIGLGHFDQGIALLEKSIAVFEDQRSGLRLEMGKIDFVGDKQAVYTLLVQTLMDQDRYDEGFAYAERGKARALVDMLASKKKFDGGNALSPSEQSQLLAQLDTAEAEMIVSKTAGAKQLVRGQATETAVKSYGNSFKYLHFASHGTFDAEKPLNSGFLLAKDVQNDGILTVGELYDLNLNADLVTLSACETALGKVANGDDVVGFTRGFLYAGASSIVSSLWQFDDAATSVLMQGFYDNLSKIDKRSALRNAQLSTKSKYHHPYYWAAFQIRGAVN